MSLLKIHSSSAVTPVGTLTISEVSGSIVSLKWTQESYKGQSPLLKTAVAQLLAFFSQSPYVFNLPINPQGTPLQKKIWKAIQAIPYGHTATYSQIAKVVTTGPRVVGQACGANPIPILIPCHRVLSIDGTLGGYSGGQGRLTKLSLLKHEGVSISSIN